MDQEGLGFKNQFHLGGIFVNFCTDRRGAIGTKIFILISLRQNQKQSFSYRNRSLTPRAIEGGSLKLLKTRVLHQIHYKKKLNWRQ